MIFCIDFLILIIKFNIFNLKKKIEIILATLPNIFFLGFQVGSKRTTQESSKKYTARLTYSLNMSTRLKLRKSK